jgi:protein KRI1
VEEKYGKEEEDEEHTSEDSSSDESEDDAAEFATEALDAEILATVQAIRAKDPRIYNKDAKFYSELEQAERAAKELTSKELASKEAPVYLRDYHRHNLLDNGSGDQTGDSAPLPYALEQEAIKRDLVKEIHTTTNGEAETTAEGEEGDDDFLVRVEKAGLKQSNSRPPIPDPKLAEREPETFLSNFLASRAWVPTETSRFQPLESDDEDDLYHAEQYEHAFNLRFEDPETSNKKLMTHSRAAVEKYTVRREEKGGRQKARDRDRTKKMEEKEKRKEERKRLKTLRVREMEEKLDKIRDAAGLSGKSVKPEEWADMLEGDWDDDKWNEEMRRRFGDKYYEDGDDISVEGEADTEETGKAKKRVKKPKWDDDLDIKDLVPDFVDEEEALPEISLSDEDEPVADSKSVATARAEAKAASRRDRRIIEALAEQSLPLDDTATYSKTPASFRYRETSPISFGLTALDILAAEDSQLNEFVGLKKLATFRDPERKKKDKKKLSKKARLREWRKDTFGREDGPAVEEYFGGNGMEVDNAEQEDSENIEASSKKHKKRKRKSKGQASSAEA